MTSQPPPFVTPDCRTLHELTRAGGCFLDAHRIGVADRDRLHALGRRLGLVDTCEVAVAQWWDNEFDTTMSAIMDSREPDEDHHTVTVQVRHLATPGLLAAQGWPDTTRMDADDLLVAHLVELAAADAASTLDGVWWDDRDDPARLSAPRGVIVSSRLDGWQRTAPH